MTEFLKCDAEGCDHVEDSPEYSRDLIGKPCPKCGASLLTQEDFDAFEPLRQVMKMLKDAGLAHEPLEGAAADLKDPAMLRVHHHDGKTTIETKPIEGASDMAGSVNKGNTEDDLITAIDDLRDAVVAQIHIVCGGEDIDFEYDSTEPVDSIKEITDLVKAYT